MRVKPHDFIYPSYFKLPVRWLRSLTLITYSSKLIGIPYLAAFLKFELFRVYLPVFYLLIFYISSACNIYLSFCLYPQIG
ncbi:hypothetical protein D5074_08765 [Pectobacterium polaris]|nr:hypothetical protein D5074_08765 [Pectobacterium polaris]